MRITAMFRRRREDPPGVAYYPLARSEKKSLKRLANEAQQRLRRSTR